MRERRLVKQGAYDLPKFRIGNSVMTPAGDETEVDFIEYDKGAHWYYLTNGTVFGEHELVSI